MKKNKKIRIKQNKANIFYIIIGRIFIYGLLYIGSIAFGVWAFLQNTIY
jgi:hypothetical protein